MTASAYNRLLEGLIIMYSPPDAQMNLEDRSFGKTSGVSPSSSTSEGTMLQISIFACSARESMRFMLGMTPGGPKMQ